MMNFELSQPDQTTVLFFIFSAAGLIRERRALPFVMVLLGSVLHGTMVAALVAGLLLWHRIDSKAEVWVRLKDFLGIFLIMGGAISPDPFGDFFAFIGVLLLSLSFGRGFLGILPALLLFRQYFPQPERPEIALVAAGVFWVAAESFRWFKSDHEERILTGLEVVCAGSILFGFSGQFDSWAENTMVIALGSALLFVAAALFAWTRWRLEGFRRILLAFRTNGLRALTFGARLVDGRNAWGGDEPAYAVPTPGSAMDRIFYLVVGALVFFGLYLLTVKGGL
jgi:predicted membrane channel-forming protein YqfA (hemolysin III family)